MLKTTSNKVEDILVISLEGRIDAHSAKDLEDQCTRWIESGEHKIIMDFAAVDFISSAGLRVVLLTAKMLSSKNGTIKLCSLNGTLRNVFEISGFSKLFVIVPSLEDALA